MKGAVAGTALLTALRAGENQAIGYVKININRWDLIESGNLINSVQEHDSYSRGTSAWVAFGPHAVYAAIHEFGGTIHATTSRGLIFQIDGRWIRVQSVEMPARPYLRPALDEHGPEILQIVYDNLMFEVERIFRGDST